MAAAAFLSLEDAQQHSPALITGGGGYLGHRLAHTLACHGVEVVLLDVRPPHPSLEPKLPPTVTFIQADLRDASAVAAAFKGIHTVFHVASYGMSGRESRDAPLIEAINVGGTRNVLAACKSAGVSHLVYCSTYNVAFTGDPIYGGDELSSAGPIPLHKFRDAYSRTKAQAEAEVLTANGALVCSHSAFDPEGTTCNPEISTAAACTPPVQALPNLSSSPAPLPSAWANSQHSAACHRRAPQGSSGGSSGTCSEDADGYLSSSSSNSSCEDLKAELGVITDQQMVLRTTAVRPAGIYGLGEMRHTPRILQYSRQGLFMFVFGEESSLSDWVLVDNLVQAMILAARGLTASAHHISAGQAYFISDDQPVNNFEFFRPLLTGLGYRFPTVRVPYRVVLGAAAGFELVYNGLRRVGLDFDPLLSKAEVTKSAVHHTFSAAKARRELGYKPVVLDSQEWVAWYREHGYANVAAPKQTGSRSATRRLTQTIMQSMAMLMLCAVVVLLLSMMLERHVGRSVQLVA